MAGPVPLGSWLTRAIHPMKTLGIVKGEQVSKVGSSAYMDGAQR